jgi:short-subunit dehydrogenase
MELNGKTVVLTGATGGIGSALALELCAEGAQVIAIGRRPAALEALRQRAAGRPGRLQPLVADLNCARDRARIAEVAAAPDALIHAAALGSFGLFADSEASEREALFQTNVLAPMALTQILLPALLQRPESRVLALGSTFGNLAHPGFAAYSASKFALRGFIEALGREHADSGLVAQWIAPRATDTTFNPPNVVALNKALKTHVDAVDEVAAQIVHALRAGTRRRQLGWPEKLFAWLNGAFPALVDRGLRSALPVVRTHAKPEQRSSPRPKSFAAAPSPSHVAAPFDRRAVAMPSRAHADPASASEEPSRSLRTPTPASAGAAAAALPPSISASQHGVTP